MDVKAFSMFGFIGSFAIVIAQLLKPMLENGLGTLIVAIVSCDLIIVTSMLFSAYFSTDVDSMVVLAHVAGLADAIWMNLSFMLAVFANLLILGKYTILKKHWYIGIGVCVSISLLFYGLRQIQRSAQSVDFELVMGYASLIYNLAVLIGTFVCLFLAGSTLLSRRNRLRRQFPNTIAFSIYEERKDKARLVMLRLVIAVSVVHLIYWVPFFLLAILSFTASPTTMISLIQLLYVIVAIRGFIYFTAIWIAIRPDATVAPARDARDQPLENNTQEEKEPSEVVSIESSMNESSTIRYSDSFKSTPLEPVDFETVKDSKL
jgi:hypothetical protein